MIDSRLGASLFTNLHHVIPKFLKGLEKATTTRLDASLHRLYHSGLRKRLTDAGVRPGWGVTWDDYFSLNREKLDVAHNVLMDYTRDFDMKYGTGLVDLIWAELYRQ